MTSAQSEQAISLLRESLDWIGVLDLTPQQEEHAEELQRRIERLLMDLGAMPGMVTRREQPRDLYDVVLRCRHREHQAKEERDRARMHLNTALELAGSNTGSNTGSAIKRFELAFSQWEGAESELFRAEADYHRSFLHGEHQCSG